MTWIGLLEQSQFTMAESSTGTINVCGHPTCKASHNLALTIWVTSFVLPPSSSVASAILNYVQILKLLSNLQTAELTVPSPNIAVHTHSPILCWIHISLPLYEGLVIISPKKSFLPHLSSPSWGQLPSYLLLFPHSVLHTAYCQSLSPGPCLSLACSHHEDRLVPYL